MVTKQRQRFIDFEKAFKEKYGVSYTRHRYVTMPKHFMIAKAKARAKRKGMEFSITMDDLEIPEFCPALGIKLQVNEGRKYSDNSPSLDRINNTKGYIKGNIQVISRLANTMKNSANHTQLVRFAIWVIGNKIDIIAATQSEQADAIKELTNQVRNLSAVVTASHRPVDISPITATLADLKNDVDAIKSYVRASESRNSLCERTDDGKDHNKEQYNASQQPLTKEINYEH